MPAAKKVKKFKKSTVTYRRFQPPRTKRLGPCMDCKYFTFDSKGDITNGRCTIVKGKIDEYFTCDKFVD